MLQGMPGILVLDTLAMVLSHILDMPIIHMLLSPLDPAMVLTPSPKDLTQSPRELFMASVRLKLMPMLKLLPAPTQLVMDMAILDTLTQLDMLATPMHLDMLGTPTPLLLPVMLPIPTQLLLVMLPTP